MKILLSHWNNVLVDIEKGLKKRGHTILNRIDKLKEIDVLVLWQESSPEARELVKKAHRLGKPVVLVQHGRRGTSRIFPPFNEKVISDKVCVWGEGDKKRHLEAGTPAEKIEITGTTIFQHLKPRKKHSGINIVFSPEHWDREVDENIIVAGQLRELEGVKIITKLLKGFHNPSYYDNPVISDRNEIGHLEICADVLSTADLVVGISESTFELMAEILDIPVVIADIWIPKPCAGDNRYLNYRREYSNACKRVKDIFNLNRVIKDQLRNPQELAEERKRIAVEDGGINIKNPLEKIIKVIENAKYNKRPL